MKVRTWFRRMPVGPEHSIPDRLWGLAWMIDGSPHGVGFHPRSVLELSDLLKEAATTVKRLQDSLEMALSTEMPTDARGSPLTDEHPLGSPRYRPRELRVSNEELGRRFRLLLAELVVIDAGGLSDG